MNVCEALGCPGIILHGEFQILSTGLGWLGVLCCENRKNRFKGAGFGKGNTPGINSGVRLRCNSSPRSNGFLKDFVNVNKWLRLSILPKLVELVHVDHDISPDSFLWRSYCFALV